jgi:hypothetical protein
MIVKEDTDSGVSAEAAGQVISAEETEEGAFM